MCSLKLRVCNISFVSISIMQLYYKIKYSHLEYSMKENQRRLAILSVRHQLINYYSLHLHTHNLDYLILKQFLQENVFHNYKHFIYFKLHASIVAPSFQTSAASPLAIERNRLTFKIDICTLMFEELVLVTQVAVELHLFNLFQCVENN